jgi:capsid protein
MVFENDELRLKALDPAQVNPALCRCSASFPTRRGGTDKRHEPPCERLAKIEGTRLAYGRQLVRLKIGALLAGFATDADGTLLQDGTAPGECSLEPGTMQRLRPGESVEFSKPPEIGAESNAFQKAVIREIGAGVGVPSFMLDHDLSEVNFSSARTAIIAFRRRVEAWQDAFAFQMLRPVYRRFLTVEILSGRITAQLGESVRRRCDHHTAHESGS